MAKYKHNQPSDQTVEEAMQVAKGTQRPGQTKEQTKLIAQGIQKGIEQYKKQQKAKARERDKLAKKAKINHETATDTNSIDTESHTSSIQWLPWILLLVSWLIFAGYIVTS